MGNWRNVSTFVDCSEDELSRILYRTCDFFVSPALYESFGMTYLEAMRYGNR